MNDFFSMGGYAAYVWSSYGIALVILLLNVIVPYRNHIKILANIARNARRNTGDRYDAKA